MLIAVVNKSTMVKDSDVQIMCHAIQIQLDLHFLPAYNLKAGTIKFYSNPAQVPGYAWIISVIDNDAQVPDALGYHQEEANGKIDGYIMCEPILTNGGAVLAFNASNPGQYTVSATLSHEVLETAGNRLTSNYYDNGGTSWCAEVCDPCEQISYSINVNGTLVSVSDFVFPAFWNQFSTLAANGPFNYLNTIKTAFSILSGGYAIIRTGGPGTETQVFGKDMPKWRKAMKKAAFSRTSRVVKARKPGLFKRIFGF